MKNVIPALVAFFVTLPVGAATLWDVDTKHSSATFTVKHMMVSNVRGQMGGITGVVEYDYGNLDTLKMKVDLDPSTINTNEPGRDAHLKNKDFLDVATYPKITFESTGVIPILEGGFKLGGKLSMHGVTKNVELSVDGPTEQIKDPKGNVKIGATATTTINRKDFGITYNTVLDGGGVAVSDEVKILLDLELTKRQDQSKDAAKTEAKSDKKAKKEKAEKPKKEKADKKKKSDDSKTDTAGSAK